MLKSANALVWTTTWMFRLADEGMSMMYCVS